MKKPDAMIRALDRAATARWSAGKVERTAHIKALTTQVREMEEDFEDQRTLYEIEAMRCQLAITPNYRCAACLRPIGMWGSSLRMVNGVRSRVGPCCARKPA